jgi:hypothetical protein
VDGIFWQYAVILTGFVNVFSDSGIGAEGEFWAHVVVQGGFLGIGLFEALRFILTPRARLPKACRTARASRRTDALRGVVRGSSKEPSDSGEA